MDKLDDRSYEGWLKEVKLETQAFYKELLERATKLGYQMYVRKMRPKKVNTISLSKDDRRYVRIIMGKGSQYNLYLDLVHCTHFAVGKAAPCFYDRYKDGTKAMTFLGNDVETLAHLAMQVQEAYPGLAWFLIPYINWMSPGRPEFWYKCKIIYKEA